MRREGVPGVVEVPLAQLRPIEGGVPDPAPEVVDVNVLSARIGKDQRAAARDDALRLQRLPHRWKHIDLALRGPGFKPRSLAMSPTFANENLVAAPVDRLPLEGDLFRGPEPGAEGHHEVRSPPH